MIKGIGHLGILVKDIEASIKALTKIVDIDIPAIKEFPDAGFKCAVVDLKGVGLEFIQDYNADGPVAQLLGEKGDMVHHFGLVSDSLEEDVALLKKRGVEMADQVPRTGLRGKKIALTTPKALNGITIELTEA